MTDSRKQLVCVISKCLSKADAVCLARSLPPDIYYVVKVRQCIHGTHHSKQIGYVVVRHPHNGEVVPNANADFFSKVQLEGLD